MYHSEKLPVVEVPISNLDCSFSSGTALSIAPKRLNKGKNVVILLQPLLSPVAGAIQLQER